ncbi:MAG: family 10 glycosylhydrolase [Oscillospiraceae bacterium]|nr:family 10 glycosylhydrolase [Oscillospiraceae bacterium]
MSKHILSLLLALTLCLLAGCGGDPAAPGADPVSAPAAPTAAPGECGEYRAVWISYLEWQGADFSGEEAFRAQMGDWFDRYAAMGLNTVIAQVRPFGDALYESGLFPWSHLCTGVQGQAPGFDPLAVLVEEAHARGLRLEAWLNPYRIALNGNLPGELAADNLYHTHPDWVKAVEPGLYLDPASEEVQAYIAQGVAEILQNYEVDGIHLDDYFYPTTDESFDADAYAAYCEAAGRDALGLGDWRRENVNALVSRLYRLVHLDEAASGRGAVLGISPQGNNDNNYAMQYSDVALWLAQPGYVDYVMPQVYWGYGYTLQSGSTRFAFENITAEWCALPRAEGVALYFGLGAYRIGDGDGGSYDNAVAQWQTGRNLADMVTTLRGLDCDGWALYRSDFLVRNGAWSELAAAECAALAELCTD